MHPVYDELAEILNIENKEVKLAKIDATVEKEIAK